MATKNKTAWAQVDVTGFIESYVDNEQQKIDSFLLIKPMTKWSGFNPEMWGPTMFVGRYHYKYASGHEGHAPMIGSCLRRGASTSDPAV